MLSEVDGKRTIETESDGNVRNRQTGAGRLAGVRSPSLETFPPNFYNSGYSD